VLDGTLDSLMRDSGLAEVGRHGFIESEVVDAKHHGRANGNRKANGKAKGPGGVRTDGVYVSLSADAETPRYGVRLPDRRGDDDGGGDEDGSEDKNDEEGEEDELIWWGWTGGDIVGFADW
jgi:hypothetical protein